MGEGEGGGEGDADAAPALIGAPEGDYNLDAFMPEGMSLDAEALAAVTPLAKEIGLSDAGLAKLALEAQPIVAKQINDRMVADVVAMRAGWDHDTRAVISGGETIDGVKVAADPAFQGKPFAEVTQTAAKAIDYLCGDKLFPAAKADGTPGTFRDFLTSTGLGNHPAMMQFAFLAGRNLSEDSDFVRMGDVPAAPVSREEKYYGRKST